MATINYAAKEISVKIVYYGPALSGKTTNLQIIHRKIPQKSKSDMVSLATESDRTLFFDFLPLDLGSIKGFKIKFQLYTVPGQVYYNATRKLVLRGVDGIVFVADSAADKMDENIESFQNMEDNLTEYGYKLDTIPIILQYNKRDLPNALPCNEIDKIINKYSFQWSEGCAFKGTGVFETLKIIGKSVVDQLNKKYAGPSKKTAAPPAVPPPAQPQTPPPVQPSRFSQQPGSDQSVFSPNQPPSHLRPTAKIPTQPPVGRPTPPQPTTPTFSPPQPPIPQMPPMPQAQAKKPDLDQEIERYHQQINQTPPQPANPGFQSPPPGPAAADPIFEPPPSVQPRQFSGQPGQGEEPLFTPNQGQFQGGGIPNQPSTPPPGMNDINAPVPPKPNQSFSGKSGGKKPMYFTSMEAEANSKMGKKFGKEEKPKKSFFGKLFNKDQE